jgi:RimJ/RimL family protein N-acetyltransferase
MPLPEIETARLQLRIYRADDLEARFALLNNPLVTRYLAFPKGWTPPTRERVREGLKKQVERWQRLGFGEWAMTLKESGELLGYCGLQHIPDESEVEVFYGLAPQHWGHGYATEGARACLRFGFEELKLERIVAAAYAVNTASLHVLEKIGMEHDPQARFYEEGEPCFVLPRAHYKRDESFYILRYV